MTEKDDVKGGKKVLVDKTYLVVQVSDNSQEDVSRFISEVEYYSQCGAVRMLALSRGEMYLGQ